MKVLPPIPVFTMLIPSMSMPIRLFEKKRLRRCEATSWDWIHFGVAEAIDYYEKLFPNKEMWITEWNIANPANRVREYTTPCNVRG